MEKKIKVKNPNKHNVGVTFLNGISRNIPPNGFVLATEDDIAYWEATSTLFKNKHLTFENDELVDALGMNKEDLVVLTDEEIEKKLTSSTLPALKAYLQSVNELHTRRRICDIAKEADLKSSKVKMIEEIFGIEIID